MIEIKPMDESYLHTRCLHDGPVDVTALGPYEDPLPEGHPALPWSDEVLDAVVEEYRSHGIRCCPPTEPFARELIRRYGSCAILAWDGAVVVGQLFFYPMTIAITLEKTGHLSSFRFMWPSAAADPAHDDTTLWILCIMSSRPYIGSEPDTITGRKWPTKQEAGARRGIGQKLVRGLMPPLRSGHPLLACGSLTFASGYQADEPVRLGPQSPTGGRAWWPVAGGLSAAPLGGNQLQCYLNCEKDAELCQTSS